MDYSNIIQAINGMNSTQSPTMDDLNRRNENYKLVDQLNQEGVSLKDVLEQIETGTLPDPLDITPRTTSEERIPW